MTKKTVSTKSSDEAIPEIVEPVVVDTPKSKETVAKHSTDNYPRFGVITLVIALVGVAISIDGLLKIREWNTGMNTFRTELEHRLDTEQKRLNTLEAALKSIDLRQQKLGTQFTYYQSIIVPVLQEKRPVDLLWQIQKADSWIQQAQLDLRWSGDWKGALLLMKATHSILDQSKIAQLDSTNQLLADDIALLSKATMIDNTKILAKIQQLSDEIPTLPAPSKPTVTPAAEASAANITFEPLWRRAWTSIKNVVIIRPSQETDAAGEGLTLEQSRQTLNDNLYMALQQTQWALLKKDDKLFHWELTQVTDIIQKNGTLIDLNDAKTTACLQDITDLQQQNLNPALPDLHPICQQLKTYINTLLAQEKRT